MGQGRAQKGPSGHRARELCLGTTRSHGLGSGPQALLVPEGDSDCCLQWESHQSHCRPPLHSYLPWLRGENSVPCAEGGRDLPTLRWQPQQC